MTIHYPDVSNWQAGLSLAGAPAAMAKATEGVGYRDPTYTDFRAQASAGGIPFAGYHYLREGDPTGQAAFAHGVVGATPLMLDVELGGPVLSWPSLAETYAFIDAYRAGGGLLTTAYIPQWFWRDYWGSPSLAGLTQRGVALISSYYTTYSDTGPGWAPYGGVTPTIWQYSSTYPFNGRQVDMNAYRGTLAELAALFLGKKGPDMSLFLVNAPGDGGIWLSDGFVRRPVYPQAQAQLYLDHGAIRISDVDLSWFGTPVGSGTPPPIDMSAVTQAAHDGAKAGASEAIDGATIHAGGGPA